MPEPFKNCLNRDVIQRMAKHFHRHWNALDVEGFVGDASNDLEALELKERSDQITRAMCAYLPDAFPHAAEIVLNSLGEPLVSEAFNDAQDETGISGWAIMPLNHYVGQKGADHIELAMDLFKEMTKRWTSEFGIRYLLLASPDEVLAILTTWLDDDSVHVRRLISEGIRPRLPWAMRLPQFMDDPAPVISLIEQLKDDGEEYVRRSVANNLNDIAKDHPDLVASIAEGWLKDASKEREKLVRHACRSLIKQGHQRTLKVLGYGEAKLKGVELVLLTPEVIFGEALQFELNITSASRQEQPIMIDYIVHHQKANGSTSPKVFKWRTATLKPNKSQRFAKRHAIKKITTRVYYPGKHTLEVVVNGKSIASADFELLM